MTPGEIRAAALAAASCWLSGVDPHRYGRDWLLETAELFAAWIEGESE